MDKTNYIMNELRKWLDAEYEKVSSVSDVRVFNAISSFATLVNGNLMNINKAHVFFTSVLSLSDHEKDRAYQVYSKAHEAGTEKRYKDEEAHN